MRLVLLRASLLGLSHALNTMVDNLYCNLVIANGSHQLKRSMLLDAYYTVTVPAWQGLLNHGLMTFYQTGISISLT
ncbi:uncharacterized protein EURHEDRAFT_543632 [Aspergillus ruber CBS 135680]|uniref:Secreted protein n=1 Tax=Aspergillus ruber (strain CBS 135680) TaxID=1388766 RepID=A0A017S8V3_ASPRC|nr:uncharacterized protein EURHEDRAFT_543632 [Aspergillus ruber CBS 135680]EYE92580.1 hypothetical protein EURHEDRAFT_543632 [Aspergillus ruber CBS 135680]